MGKVGSTPAVLLDGVSAPELVRAEVAPSVRLAVSVPRGVPEPERVGEPLCVALPVPVGVPDGTAPVDSDAVGGADGDGDAEVVPAPVTLAVPMPVPVAGALAPGLRSDATLSPRKVRRASAASSPPPAASHSSVDSRTLLATKLLGTSWVMLTYRKQCARPSSAAWLASNE